MKVEGGSHQWFSWDNGALIWHHMFDSDVAKGDFSLMLEILYMCGQGQIQGARGPCPP